MTKKNLGIGCQDRHEIGSFKINSLEPSKSEYPIGAKNRLKIYLDKLLVITSLPQIQNYNTDAVFL